MAAASVNSAPRYAPPDPTLPHPWRALVDGTTGYIYYWNTETNVTQYEKPLAPNTQVPPPAAPQPGSVGPQQTQTSLPSEHQNARSMESRNPVNSNVVPSTTVTSHGNGINAQQTSSSIGNTHPQNGYTAMANHASGGVARSNVQMHMNVGDTTYGMNGRATHSNGTSVSGNNRIYGGQSCSGSDGSMRNGVAANVPIQPKLAAVPVPQRQQVMPGMHMPVGLTSSQGHPASIKRSANDFGNNEPDIHKRPRTQSFSDPICVDVDSYKQQHEITVLGDNIPAPFMTFDAAGLPAEVLREVHSAGFTHPTPIQAQTWPIALQGRDIVAIAKTGSGKTLGYLLPAFLHLARCRSNSQLGPSVLVLAPTRELATQIQDEALKFGKSSRISCACVYGGAPKGPQLRDIDRGADIIIATPGRLNDFLELRKVSLRQVSYLVLDEADRMLDMGFEPQIRKIVKEIPARRQTLMYTATWPKEVRKISSELLRSAVQVNIGNSDQLVANKSITQLVEVVSPYEKQRRLEEILRSQEPGSKIIIFCSTKKMCDQLARSLARGFGAAAIHGDKSQSERDYVLAQFKAGRSPVLVATDVAARGLDIKDIRVVVNFDFPTGVEDYVHRIGRTGRAGATGIAFTFFADQDSKYAKELIAVLEGANQKVPPQLRDLAAKSFHSKGRGRWDSSGGMGGRDGGFSFGGRGGGRGDGYGGRGSWGSQVGNFERRDRYPEKDRFPSKNGGARERFSDDRNRGRDVQKRHSGRDRGRSYSRSYSRSPSRSRGRSPSCSRSHSRSSGSRSRSRSRSYDKYSDDRNRSPYKGRSSCRSKTPRSRSPLRSRSPRQSKFSNAISSDDRRHAVSNTKPTEETLLTGVHLSKQSAAFDQEAPNKATKYDQNGDSLVVKESF